MIKIIEFESELNWRRQPPYCAM